LIARAAVVERRHSVAIVVLCAENWWGVRLPNYSLPTRIRADANYQPVAAANWSGFYLGGNFGSGTGRDRASLSVPAIATVETFNLAPDGFNGGVQAGYNWQAANWVFGLETDFQGSSQKDNKTCVLTCGSGGGACGL
jgi:outer membrane immunogenic protein